MPDDQPKILILGACQNNLRNIDVELPHNALTVITGPSGSGKSSLAFDTLYAEGQRRYVESMSAYARQFLERIQKPAVREIRGISPAIAIRQRGMSRNPRSTVGTVTEIYDFLRLLYSRAGSIRCHSCGREVKKDSIDTAVEELLGLPAGVRALITFPFSGSALDLETENVKDPGEALREQLENLLKQGFFRLIASPVSSSPVIQLPAGEVQSVEQLRSLNVLIDRLVINEGARDRLADSLEMCFAEGNGLVEVTLLADSVSGLSARTMRFTERLECQHCGISYRAPEPRLFSFNNPYGACPTCHGFGNTITLDPDLVIPNPRKTLLEGPIDPFNKPRYRRFQRRLIDYAQKTGIPTDVPFHDLPEEARRRIWDGDKGFPGVKGFFRYLARKKYKMHIRIFIARYRGYARCPDCDGERLRQEARDVYLGDRRITQLVSMPVSDLIEFFGDLRLPQSRLRVAGRLTDEVRRRLEFLKKVGLEYLTLARLTSTLSGGEMQRIHLSASLGSALVGTLYVLDEPSIGLHPRDQARLVGILRDLRDLGNTIVVVEHEQEIIRAGDHIVDMGPGAGEFGGEVVHSGNLAALLSNHRSLTAKYLTGEKQIHVPAFRRPISGPMLVVRGAAQHNLKQIDLEVPLKAMVCVTGVSGSGKSTLVHDVLYAGIKKLRGEWNEAVGRVREIEGWERFSEILLVDQSPIGRTPRSNPVTYIKAYDDIRKIFSAQSAAQTRNLKPADFSFNTGHGRCPTCQGTGTLTIEMQFLADVEVECEDCKGTRFQHRVLEVTYKGKNIHEVLHLTVHEAISFFRGHAALTRKLQVLQDIGLGYLRLGQSATTLSGGEAQRIKLTAFLTRKTTGHPLFIFDEPTTGLHFDDIDKLLGTFDKLISRGATLLVIEHNLEVIKCADWVIDLGPEGGEDGGFLVASGPPEQIALCPTSHTGQFLRDRLPVPASS